MSKRTQRKTVTFDPDEDVKSMLGRACTGHGGRPIWGYRSHLINAALREHLRKEGFRPQAGKRQPIKA